MRASSISELFSTQITLSECGLNALYIVAVSGGCDSMVLLDLCRQSGLRIVIAHVNYGLRGENSDADESLVKRYCVQYDVPFEAIHIIEDDWTAHPGSTQEAARKMRYSWFELLMKKHGAWRVLTAHHANDQTETMLMQFIRGGAGKSVYGMASDNGVVLRPLLGATRAELRLFAQQHAVPWREDQSNQSDVYTRNKLRHHIVPVIESINPKIHDGIQQRAEWIHQEQTLLDFTLSDKLKSLTHHDGNIQLMAATTLHALPYRGILLWHWLQPHGFSSEVVVAINHKATAQNQTEPAWFASNTHEVCVQRDEIALLEKQTPTPILIESLPWLGSTISLSACNRNEIEFGEDIKTQFLDASTISFPLTIREWQEGDRFTPLGAPGRQKVSDFLTHAKVPAWKKKHVQILESDGRIAAVLGLRICHDFKISDHSAACVKISFG